MNDVVCVDPGLLTGVGLISGTTFEVLESHELSIEDFEKWLEDVLFRYPAGTLDVVAENFIITVETAKKSQSPWSLKLLGVLSYLSRKAGHGEPRLQTPAEAKSLVPNDRLKSVGVWHRGGEGHARDSLRHGVYYLVVRKGWRPEGLLASD